MSNKPSLDSLIARAKTTMVGKLGVDNTAIDALAAAIGGGNYGQYAYQDYLFAQLNPETADENWLYLWANRLHAERILPEKAAGTVNFLNVAGVVSVPAGAVLKTADDKQYVVSTATLSDQAVPVIAVTAGLDSNLAAGVTLYLTSAIFGLNPDTITSNTIGGGSDIEDLEHWRNRVVAAFKENNAVGRLEDYKTWAISAHADVDFGWALNNTPALGNVTVYIGQREAAPVLSDAIKTVVQTYIDSVRLAGCHVFVQHPTIKVLDLTISNVPDLNVRTDIANTLQAYINGRLGDQLPITASELVVAITGATTSFSLVSPLTSTTPADNEVITLGVITWL